MKDNIIKKKAASFILAFIAVLILAAVYQFRVRKDMSDFGVCFKAGQRILWGETLYRESDGHLLYKYSPVSALFFSAFSLVSYETAKIIWYALQFFFLPAIFFLSYKILPNEDKKAGIVAVFSFLILAKFLGREVELGQINLFIIFVLTLMFVFFLKKKEVPAGLLWGASLFFKPYALVFFPYFAAKKKYKMAAAGSALFLVGLVAPTLFYGFRGNLVVSKEWIDRLSHSTPALLSVSDNASLYGFLLKAFPNSWKTGIEIFLMLLFMSLVCAVFWMMKAGKSIPTSQRPEVLESSVLLILIPLFSPLGWYYNYLYSFLGIMLLVSGFRKFPPFLRYLLIINFAIIGGSLVEILGREFFRFYTKYSLVVINCAVILFCLFYLRLKKYY